MIRIGLVAALLLAAGTTGPAHGGSSRWSTARHDVRRTARSPVVAAQGNELRWAPRSSGSGAVPSAAVEGPDGTVYVSNGGALRAVDPAGGTTRWSVAATLGRKMSAPAVAADGTILVSQAGGSQPALVVALDAAGVPRWTYTTPEIVAYFSDLATDETGRVFGRYLETQFTSWHAFALDGVGVLLWKTSVPYASEFDPTPPALVAGGDVVLTAIDDAWADRLWRLDGDTGAIEWSVAPGGALSAPVIADDGRILVHSPGFPPDGGVRAFDPEGGAPVWHVPYLAAEYGENNPPVLLPGGEIAAIANGDDLGNRVVYRISPDGVLLGTAPYPSTGYYVNAVAGGDGTLYVWTSMRLLAFSPTTGVPKFEYYPAPTSSCLRTSPPTILSDGSIFASWQRKQTCNSPSSFGEYVVLAGPTATTAAGVAARGTDRARLHGVTPNPAVGSATVRWELPRAGRASLRVVDVHGSVVRVLEDGQAVGGLHARTWDGRDGTGARCTAGVYFVVLASEQGRESAKLVLLDGRD